MSLKSKLPNFPESIEVLDSHTEGEPTRVVLGGWPELSGDTMQERRAEIETDFDDLRRSVVCEPRGHDAIVGALLTPAVEPGSAAGVVFFNNVGCLGMCGHGLIGVVRTLDYLGRLESQTARIDTPVGTVKAQIESDGSITIQNVASYCHELDVVVEVSGLGTVTGDIAWGGNWFFLTRLAEPDLELENLGELMRATGLIRQALDRARLLGDQGVIDHIELFGPPSRADADSRNFVLCPGGEYDRSPCGTGTSAKMAVLHQRGELQIGQEWHQESITGSRFIGWLSRADQDLVPHIRGRAWITGHNKLFFAQDDLFRGGFPGASGRDVD